MKCVICNKEFEVKHIRQNTCSEECKRERHLENMRNASSHNVVKKPKTFYKGQQCRHKNCKYRAGISGMLICNYLSDVGHSRGCSAKECDKYVKKTVPRKKTADLFGGVKCQM